MADSTLCKVVAFVVSLCFMYMLCSFVLRPVHTLYIKTMYANWFDEQSAPMVVRCSVV